MINEQTKEQVAYHEAGHAAMVCLFPHITIVTGLTNLADGKGAEGKCSYVLAHNLEGKRLKKREQLAATLIATAGPIVEEKLYGHSSGAGSDMNKLLNFMFRWDLSAEYGGYLIGIVKKVIDDHWELVEKIAKLLIEKETIDVHFFYENVTRPYIEHMPPETCMAYVEFLDKFESELKKLKRTRRKSA